MLFSVSCLGVQVVLYYKFCLLQTIGIWGTFIVSSDFLLVVVHSMCYETLVKQNTYTLDTVPHIHAMKTVPSTRYSFFSKIKLSLQWNETPYSYSVVLELVPGSVSQSIQLAIHRDRLPSVPLYQSTLADARM